MFKNRVRYKQTTEQKVYISIHADSDIKMGSIDGNIIRYEGKKVTYLKHGKTNK
jgi:predicted RNA binding protein YcfA (HicA-like mRNA interferase family)